MTEQSKLFVPEDDEAEEQALREADADLEAGRVVPHADVARWLEDMAAGIRRPQPQPWK